MAVWRPSTGVWYGVASSSGRRGASAPWGYSTDQPVPGDYDGDGRADLAVYRSSTHERFIIPSNGGNSYAQVDGTDRLDRSIVGDFDGDNKGDVFAWKPATGMWTGWLSLTGAKLNQQWG